ncbi:hypothetical protein X798_05245 [Onchocerca flexuosa]|uniref:Uncharacterized protein n=1 Tax=Onchocerca flexuosa TaxID=387005 RepID=A0A238BSV6_9BILA|nr:hypothetical protein X798_05245 [Onchocerca flexuosa]
MNVHVLHAHSYLDLHIKLSPTGDTIICENDPPCSIPYAISVLYSPNHFDLQAYHTHCCFIILKDDEDNGAFVARKKCSSKMISVMMQDGGLLRHNHNRYSDSTVIRLTKAMKLYNGKIYLGLRLFDLPFGMQEYGSAPIKIQYMQ